MKSVSEFQEFKGLGQKISMVTCYDFAFAKILDQSAVDCILVGDSVAMVVHGHKTTLAASTEMMRLHIDSVSRGAPSKFIVGDLPFLSYRKGLSANMNNVETLMKAGAHALKLEGADGNLQLIRHCVNSGVPIMGHLGLTPQSIHKLGGFKVQGKIPSEYERIIAEAKQLEDAGCFAVVLECVPAPLGKEISEALQIPTIGIGAGADCDGQVLVLHDLLGIQNDFKPKFLRTYFEGAELMGKALNSFHQDVRDKKFPSASESYK